MARKVKDIHSESNNYRKCGWLIRISNLIIENSIFHKSIKSITLSITLSTTPTSIFWIYDWFFCYLILTIQCRHISSSDWPRSTVDIDYIQTLIGYSLSGHCAFGLSQEWITRAWNKLPTTVSNIKLGKLFNFPFCSNLQIFSYFAATGKPLLLFSSNSFTPLRSILGKKEIMSNAWTLVSIPKQNPKMMKVSN